MQQESGLWHDVFAFLGVLFEGWAKYTTGGGLVALGGSYVALSGPSAETAHRIAWVIFGSAVLAGVFRAWRKEYRRRGQLEDLPQLQLMFVPGKQPYEQDHTPPEAKGYLSHYFRVGVTHDGPGQVEDVRVLLAALEPLPAGFPLFHALALMGEPKGTQSGAVAAGTQPTRFFDVIVQVRSVFIVSDNKDPTPTPELTAIGDLVVCFAAGERPGVPPTILSMRLLAEGRNAKSAELHFEMTNEGRGAVLELRPRH